MARRIALLCGGASGEREVSLLSAAAVEEALEKRYEVIKIDTGVEGWAHTLLDSSVEGVFICLHGGAGENGRFRGSVKALACPIRGRAFSPARLQWTNLWQNCWSDLSASQHLDTSGCFVVRNAI